MLYSFVALPLRRGSFPFGSVELPCIGMPSQINEDTRDSRTNDGSFPQLMRLRRRHRRRHSIPPSRRPDTEAPRGDTAQFRQFFSKSFGKSCIFNPHYHTAH